MESATIVACECGKQVRLPVQRGNRTFRCPVCKATLGATLDARVLSARQLAPGEPGATCPICQSAIAAEEFVVRCPDCEQVHHRECWTEIGGCGTYGCAEAPTKGTHEGFVRTPVRDDTKTCPVCGESIKSIALLCRYCKTDFDTADPLTRADIYLMETRAGEQKKLRSNIVALFVLTLLGVTAPLAGLIGSAYLLPKHRQWTKCGLQYSILAWATLIVSGIFTVSIVVSLLFEWT